MSRLTELFQKYEDQESVQEETKFKENPKSVKRKPQVSVQEGQIYHMISKN